MVLLVVHKTHDGSHDILHGRLQLCMAPRPHCIQGEGIRDASRGKIVLLQVHNTNWRESQHLSKAACALQSAEVREYYSSSANLKIRMALYMIVH